jgi:hypothetical protein
VESAYNSYRYPRIHAVENGNGLGYDYPGIDFPDGFVNGAVRDSSRPRGSGKFTVTDFN